LSFYVIHYEDDIMTICLYESNEQYDAEYQQVRAKLVAQGSSLNEWLNAQNISRQLAYKALKGQSFGRKAIALRARILNEILKKVA